jgi:hypothetical protein
MTDRSASRPTDWDRIFRWAAVLFGIVVALHGTDPLRRGVDVIPPAVMAAGMVQLVLVAATVGLVFARSPWAPYAAIAIGFISAADFTAAHLLPKWGFFSDSFINATPAARVTTFSWITAILEIMADLVVGAIGVAVLRARDDGRMSGTLFFDSACGMCTRTRDLLVNLNRTGRDHQVHLPDTVVLDQRLQHEPRDPGTARTGHRQRHIPLILHLHIPFQRPAPRVVGFQTVTTPTLQIENVADQFIHESTVSRKPQPRRVRADLAYRWSQRGDLLGLRDGVRPTDPRRK